ncbi:Uncharacterized conserved protein YbjT, contains NAD(P)-binding and DUF2867 domains [Micromonospora nigra]|uniref:Uncharacterized conserved protein YbjT, contains NAD(P)-binding and DUF2867 domains n=1 Tax=Micromonospora nigra TaxID=145857 RepID=A0A1C6T001_9ACTN|nr:NAD(P)H-binding protein [Micromonospora nigra]SCL35150.1 Uncharacterized conserved protein YbjT, contains NAD(P)-binding and DUF2867 domains [Micromonospora nigra]
MTSPILVTGGTGTLGQLVVPRLRAAGHTVRVLSRRSRQSADGVTHVVGDLHTGVGVDAALADVEVVVHCAGSAAGDEEKARRITAATARAGVRHLVNISVVGADRIPVTGPLDRIFGYYAAQAAAERVVAAGPVPWTTLRATQFHDLILTMARGLTRLPVMPALAGFRFQPIDAAEVADRLVELALGDPSGLVPEIGGPQVRGMDELLRAYLHAAGRRRPIVPVRLPGRAARAFRAGANLAPDRPFGRRNWEDFLAERCGVAA